MDQLRALRYFVAVAETGSFTESAKRFGVPPSSLSRRVADLENSLGANLLQRTTRLVKLTEVGQEYYRQVKDVLERLSQTDESVRNYQTEPMGRLRISSMVGFGERILLPLLDKLKAAYPKIVLDVSLTDEVSTLNRDDIDIAIRGGYVPNERVVALPLLDNNFIAVAAERYLIRAGIPKNPFDLKQHQGLYFRTPMGPTPWLTNIDGQWHDVSGPAALISNNGQWLVRQAINGEGILFLPRWVLQEAIAHGHLQELRFDHPVNITQQPDLGVYLLYQKHRYAIPKIRVAVDFIRQEISPNTR
ncbi:MAG: LysR family transcriptional regulator [Reinekea sp.]|jgi:DNA-binding transcriptional LysR family regulator|nr:LysR family transcriptional regulator [Reinekea sp.]